MRYAVNFDDPGDVRRWLDALRAEVEELVDLGEEAARKKAEHVVSRAHVRADLERTMASLRNCSERGGAGSRRSPPLTTERPPPFAVTVYNVRLTFFVPRASRSDKPYVTEHTGRLPHVAAFTIVEPQERERRVHEPENHRLLSHFSCRRVMQASAALIW